jgi:outer membrane cobalamin receptor
MQENLNGRRVMMISFRASLLLGAPLVALCTAAPRPVQAQQAAPQPDSTAPLLLEEIIVTAEKMGSGRPLQQVPIAITGVDAEQIQTSHMVNVQDVGRMAPDVYLDTSGTLSPFAV